MEYANFSGHLRPEQLDNTLTVQKAKQILFLSFRFSQGLSQNQFLVYKYLHAIHPEWSIPDGNFKSELEVNAIDNITRFLHPKEPEKRLHKQTFTLDILDQARLRGLIKTQLSIMQDVINGQPVRTIESRSAYIKKEHELLLSREEIVPELSESIIERDYVFLVARSGREGKKVDGGNPITDPYDSHIVTYALRGTKTGLAEYDRMFQDVGDYVRGKYTDSNWEKRDLFMRVRQSYNKHHPNKPFELPNAK